MAVASKSDTSVHKVRVPAKARTVTELNPKVMTSSAKTQIWHNSPILLSSRSAPLWLLRLCYLQQRFSAIAFLLVTGMLVVYGWVVYSQKMWNQAYGQLEILQIQERQLSTTNEALKNQMMRQAQQPDAGLVSPNPAEGIVLQPDPPRPLRTAESAPSITNSSTQTEQTTPIPLGY